MEKHFLQIFRHPTLRNHLHEAVFSLCRIHLRKSKQPNRSCECLRCSVIPYFKMTQLLQLLNPFTFIGIRARNCFFGLDLTLNILLWIIGGQKSNCSAEFDFSFPHLFVFSKGFWFAAILFFVIGQKEKMKKTWSNSNSLLFSVPML